MTVVLSGRYRFHIAYQCQCCPWGDLVALSGVTLTNAEIWRLFSCPYHGAEKTSIRTLDMDLLEFRRGKK